MPDNVINRAKYNLKHHLILRSLVYRLKYIGIQMVLYYVHQESYNQDIEPLADPEIKLAEVSILSASELEKVTPDLDSKGFTMFKGDLKNQGFLCFALKLQGEIVATTWCNLVRSYDSYAYFPLKEDEAYLCNAYTLPIYRGKNAAPYLRYQVYKYLNGIGRNKFYSFTDFLNTPAVKFKEKLGARKLSLGLNIKLFNKWRRNITIKKYRI